MRITTFCKKKKKKLHVSITHCCLTRRKTAAILRIYFEHALFHRLSHSWSRGKENKRCDFGHYFLGNFQKRMEHHLPKSPKKRSTTSRGIPKFQKKLSWNFPFHLTFLPEFQIFSVEWFPVRKFTPFSEFLETFPGKFCTFCRCFQIFESFS